MVCEFKKQEFKAILERAAANDPTLTVICLQHFLLTDQDASEIRDALLHNTHVFRLDVSRNYLRRTGAASIGELLASNFTLRIVLLGYNALGAEGLATMWCFGMKNNVTLEFLGLEFTRISGRLSYMPILTMLQRNTQLHVDLRFNLILDRTFLERRMLSLDKTNNKYTTLGARLWLQRQTPPKQNKYNTRASEAQLNKFLAQKNYLPAELIDKVKEYLGTAKSRLILR